VLEKADLGTLVVVEPELLHTAVVVLVAVPVHQMAELDLDAAKAVVEEVSVGVSSVLDAA